MTWATHSCPDLDAPPARPLTVPEIRALRAEPKLPIGSSIRLQKICEQGAWFCARCCAYLFQEDRQFIKPPQSIRCDKCELLMKWQNPIY